MASASDRATADPLIGMTLGDYVVEEAVGFGGMGIVYRAMHPLIGRKVAVKVLRPEQASDPEQAARFLKEAQALSGIKHRGIIDIISFGNLPDGRQYMVMEFLDGESLEEEVGLGALPPARVVALADEILDALSAAHKVGVVHRDLKPSNVFMLRQSNNTRVVKLVDFGLARRATLKSLERVGDKASLMAGTPEYLAPEQANGLAATPRTDLYSFGVMLFEMLTGRLPFEEQGVVPLIEAHCNKPPPRVRTYAPLVPEALDELVNELLQKAPGDRPQSAAEVRQRLQRIGKDLHEASTVVTYVPRPSGEKRALQPPAPPAPRPAPPTQTQPKLGGAALDSDKTAEALQPVADTTRLERPKQAGGGGGGLGKLAVVAAALAVLAGGAFFASRYLGLTTTEADQPTPPEGVAETPVEVTGTPPERPVDTPPAHAADTRPGAKDVVLADLPHVKTAPKRPPPVRCTYKELFTQHEKLSQAWYRRGTGGEPARKRLTELYGAIEPFQSTKPTSRECADLQRQLRTFEADYVPPTKPK